MPREPGDPSRDPLPAPTRTTTPQARHPRQDRVSLTRSRPAARSSGRALGPGRIPVRVRVTASTPWRPGHGAKHGSGFPLGREGAVSRKTRKRCCCEGTSAAAKSLQSCLTLCDPIDGSPPGSPVPGKNTGVGCHFLLQCRKVKSESEVAQSWPTLHDPMDCSSLPGSSIHGILQARVLEWGAIAFSE